jgi:hypothetical protein
MSEIMDAANRVAASQLAAALIAKDVNFPDTAAEGIQAAIKIYASVLKGIAEAGVKTSPGLNISEAAFDNAGRR